MGFTLTTSASPIIPILVGKAHVALEFSEQLLTNGLFAPPIRPPTVPEHTSRLRVTVSSEHTAAQIEQALATFKRAGRAVGLL